MKATRYTLPREQRLKSRTQINLLFQEGKWDFVFPIRYLVRIERLDPQQTGGHTQARAVVMVSVPKRLHKRAHIRNLLKRRMREAYRLNKGPLCDMCAHENSRLSLGLLYTSDEIATFRTIEHAVQKIIQTILSHN